MVAYYCDTNIDQRKVCWLEQDSNENFCHDLMFALELGSTPIMIHDLIEAINCE